MSDFNLIDNTSVEVDGLSEIISEILVDQGLENVSEVKVDDFNFPGVSDSAYKITADGKEFLIVREEDLQSVAVADAESAPLELLQKVTDWEIGEYIDYEQFQDYIVSDYKNHDGLTGNALQKLTEKELESLRAQGALKYLGDTLSLTGDNLLQALIDNRLVNVLEIAQAYVNDEGPAAILSSDGEERSLDASDEFVWFKL